jgi:hypothetical protein
MTLVEFYLWNSTYEKLNSQLACRVGYADADG